MLTVRQLVESFVEREAKPNSPKSWNQILGHLERDVLPRWGQRSAISIGKADCVQRLAELAGRTCMGANRVRTQMLRMFN